MPVSQGASSLVPVPIGAPSRCGGHGGSGPHFTVAEMDLMMLDVIEPQEWDQVAETHVTSYPTYSTSSMMQKARDTSLSSPHW